MGEQKKYIANKGSLLEELMLKRILGFSLLGIIPYLVRSSCIAYHPQELKSSLSALLLYLSLLVWLHTPGNIRAKKHFVVNTWILSVVVGFFMLGGMRGVIAFDMVNLLFFIVLVCSGWERRWYLAVMGSIFMMLACCHLFRPEYISSPQDPMWFTVANSLIRLSMSLTIGMTLRHVLMEENKKVFQLLNEVRNLNREVLRHNEELRTVSEKLRVANNLLEEKVEERTAILKTNNQKLLVYSYINSHVFRAPIARIKSILQLKSWADDQEQEKLDKMLHSQAEDIDKIIHTIADIINGRENEELQKMVQQAEKIYPVE